MYRICSLLSESEREVKARWYKDVAVACVYYQLIFINSNLFSLLEFQRLKQTEALKRIVVMNVKT